MDQLWYTSDGPIRKFRIGPSLRIESQIVSAIRNRIESRSFAGPYYIGALLIDKLIYCMLQPLGWIKTLHINKIKLQFRLIKVTGNCSAHSLLLSF